jgi:hypothetical protein
LTERDAFSISLVFASNPALREGRQVRIPMLVSDRFRAVTTGNVFSLHERALATQTGSMATALNGSVLGARIQPGKRGVDIVLWERLDTVRGGPVRHLLDDPVRNRDTLFDEGLASDMARYVARAALVVDQALIRWRCSRDWRCFRTYAESERF